MNMSTDYLKSVLDAQRVADNSTEMKDLQAARKDVEDLLCAEFDDCKPTIRYGGSKAKETMNLEDYDLDIITYFPREDTKAGKTIKEIYENVQKALQKAYRVDPKTTALRVSDSDHDLKIDVVPGRFIDDSRSDAFVHQNGGSKEFLKTNLDVHIAHIRDSGFVPEIRLAKLWRPCAGIVVRTFPLDLVTVKFLKQTAKTSLEARLIYLMERIRDDIASVSIEDPANSGNDLSEALSAETRKAMAAAARSTLQTVERSGWESIFGRLSSGAKKASSLRASVQSMPTAPRPWRIE
jgi:hypothetical protein